MGREWEWIIRVNDYCNIAIMFRETNSTVEEENYHR